jgi:hypothetical protein
MFENGGLKPFMINNPISEIIAKAIMFLFLLKRSAEKPITGRRKSK